METIMPKLELISPNFLRSTSDPISQTQKTLVKKFVTGCTVSPSIEKFLTKMNLANSYEEIPNAVQFSYNALIARNVDLKDTVELITLTASLAANKFNEKFKPIRFTGFAGADAIDNDTYKKLTSAGFVGCALSPLIHGIEAATEARHCIEKDPSYWSPVTGITQKTIMANSKPLTITLTFRQEQILKMICTHGMTNYQIAKRLDLSESTVKMHIGIVLKKYNAQHRSQLIILDKQGRL